MIVLYPGQPWSKFLPHYACGYDFRRHTWSGTMFLGLTVEETIQTHFHQSPLALIWRDKSPI